MLSARVAAGIAILVLGSAFLPDALSYIFGRSDSPRRRTPYEEEHMRKALIENECIFRIVKKKVEWTKIGHGFSGVVYGSSDCKYAVKGSLEF